LIISRHRIQQLDLESVGQADPLGRRCARLSLRRESNGEYYRHDENKALHKIVGWLLCGISREKKDPTDFFVG